MASFFKTYSVFLLSLILGITSCQDELIFESEPAEAIKLSEGNLKGSHHYCGNPTTKDLFADQDIDVGDIIVGNDEENLYVTITMTGGWYMTNTKLWLGDDKDDLPVNKAGNPVRGKFDVNDDFGGGSIFEQYIFPLSSLGIVTPCECTVVIAVHADVEMVQSGESGDIVIGETAWGNGVPIGGKAWGWYIDYNIMECGWQCGDPITDERDLKQYNTVMIGDQCWMAENLAYLPSVSPSSEGSLDDPYYYVYGYIGNDLNSAKGTANYNTYGALYNWAAASSDDHDNGNDVCPVGWHLPSDSEWAQMADYLELNGYGYEGSGDDIGKSLAAASGWDYSNIAGAVGNDQASNNDSGFSALPGGYRDTDGIFRYEGWLGQFRSSTVEDDYPGTWHLFNNGAGLYNQHILKSYGFSIRCVMD